MRRGVVVGREIVYCNQCGLRITAADFEKGRAATVLGKNYCRRCMKDVIGEETPAEKTERPTSKTPARGSPSTRAPQKAPLRAQGSQASKTGKVPLAKRAGLDTTTRAFIIGGAIVLLALILLVVVLSRGRTTG